MESKQLTSLTSLILSLVLFVVAFVAYLGVVGLIGAALWTASGKASVGVTVVALTFVLTYASLRASDLI